MSRLARLAFGLTAISVLAIAQVITPFTPRFSTKAQGDVTLIANTVLTCNPTGMNGSFCASAQNGTGSLLNNNSFDMMNVDVDSDPTTFNSSSATLSLPPSSSVLFAGLYWTGFSNQVLVGGVDQRRIVKLSTPSAPGMNLMGVVVGSAVNFGYISFANVTGIVQASGNGTYTVGNVQTLLTTSNAGAGWALVLVYQDLTQPLRSLTVFDGYAEVGTAGITPTTSISGFVAPPSGPIRARVGSVAFEGDRSVKIRCF